MIQLIVYGIFAAVVIGGFFAVVHKHDDGIRATEAAEWKPKLEAAQADTKTAVDANASLQQSVKDIDAQRQQCSAAVQALGNAGKVAEAAKAKALTDAGKQLGSLATDKLATEAQLAATTNKAEACDVQLAKVNSVLGELGARRLRDHPGAASGQPGGNAPAGKDSGADTVRIGK